ncbi:hypothetical protein I3843_15G065100 [Carya illinoinensis]|uniref:Secreted protein n=1 Tax=Carya illinoinensis TaxID=32201 RepID=A0A922AC10_CARIL|nr:hypothetical protein I3760_15G067100 [Carya illinoinensis]KAG6674852.1 hypothetical protein I3842_15G067500 [Carya illinoinensis]KAG7943833.1 hypothetical protein I3843_15G065100 [Carya illinoinensis]
MATSFCFLCSLLLPNFPHASYLFIYTVYCQDASAWPKLMIPRDREMPGNGFLLRLSLCSDLLRNFPHDFHLLIYFVCIVRLHLRCLNKSFQRVRECHEMGIS